MKLSVGGSKSNHLLSMVADPSRQIVDLPIMTVAEQNQLLVEWNNTQVDYPPEQCIHQLFEAQVNETPNAIAVVLSVTEAGEADWKRTSRTIDPDRPNPSVSDYSYRHSRRNNGKKYYEPS